MGCAGLVLVLTFCINSTRGFDSSRICVQKELIRKYEARDSEQRKLLQDMTYERDGLRQVGVWAERWGRGRRS